MRGSKPANKITDDIRMADKNFITVFFLGNLCSVEILSKSSFNSCTVSVELLEVIYKKKSK